MNNDRTSQLKTAIVELLRTKGADTSDESLLETPDRFIKQISESLCGYADDPKNHIKLFPSENYHDLVQVSQISFTSVCEHHLLPFYGYVDIGYVPGEYILGLSKFARIVDSFSKRLQVQERLSLELADFLYDHLKPDLLMVRLRAKHTCMIVRGVLRPEAVTDTLTLRGDTIKHQTFVQSFSNSKDGGSL